jgi:hypothetical protein
MSAFPYSRALRGTTRTPQCLAGSLSTAASRLAGPSRARPSDSEVSPRAPAIRGSGWRPGPTLPSWRESCTVRVPSRCCISVQTGGARSGSSGGPLRPQFFHRSCGSHSLVGRRATASLPSVRSTEIGRRASLARRRSPPPTGRRIRPPSTWSGRRRGLDARLGLEPGRNVVDQKRDRAAARVGHLRPARAAAVRCHAARLLETQNETVRRLSRPAIPDDVAGVSAQNFAHMVQEVLERRADVLFGLADESQNCHALFRDLSSTPWHRRRCRTRRPAWAAPGGTCPRRPPWRSNQRDPSPGS